MVLYLDFLSILLIKNKTDKNIVNDTGIFIFILMGIKIIIVIVERIAVASININFTNLLSSLTHS